MEKIDLRFTRQEKELIQGLTMDESGVAASLAKARARDGRYKISCSLDALDDLLNSIAFDANHAETPKMEDKLDRLFGRLEQIQQKTEDAL